MEACGKWKADIEEGTLDLKAVFWTGEKIFRLGALKAGSQNLVVYVGSNAGKREVRDDLIPTWGRAASWGSVCYGAFKFALRAHPGESSSVRRPSRPAASQASAWGGRARLTASFHSFARVNVPKVDPSAGTL